MCGITGILNFNGKSVEPSHLLRMARQLTHRGPDDLGVFRDKSAGLAHTRLSIIDLASGRQPMHNDDRSLSIVFNGEIFNYIELKNDLIERGVSFRTQSDTEVLLRLYEQEGEECVHKLNGQWAFAIWDSKQESLFLSRDRLGVRPLFYTVTNDAFLFASEIKSIFAVPGISREIDPVALHQIFTFWVSIPPQTFFKNVSELPPGHSLTVKDRHVSLKRYWNLDFSLGANSVDSGPAAEERYTSDLLDLLIDATRIRLRSDVPVGAYLSGGLDSSLITALIKRFTNAPLKTFSVAFEDSEFDESSYQNEVARFLNTDHYEAHCDYDDIARILPSVIWHAEKPVLRTAPAPLYILSQLVRNHGYKVVLTGEGADEMFGGYDIFKEAKVRRFCAAQPDSGFRRLLYKRLYPYQQAIKKQPDAYLSAFFQARPNDLTNEFFSHLPRWQMTSRLKMLFSGDVKAQTGSGDVSDVLRNMLPANYFTWNGFCQAQYLESAYLLPGYILSSQGDRVAMAHSVEGRFPFLDYRVVEFASKVPPSLKMKVLNEKYLLKRCADRLLPPSITKRPKQPYRAPDGKSFFQGKTHEYVDALLSADRVRQDGLFDPAAVENLVEKFRKGRAIGVRDNMGFVGILSAQLVVDQFVRNFGVTSSYAEHPAGIAAICH